MKMTQVSNDVDKDKPVMVQGFEAMIEEMNDPSKQGWTVIEGHLFEGRPVYEKLGDTGEARCALDRDGFWILEIFEGMASYREDSTLEALTKLVDEKICFPVSETELESSHYCVDF